MRIAYLISQYPAESHTFIRRELEALRARGISIDTFSIRPPPPDECTSQQSHDARDSTYYVLPGSLMVFLTSHLVAFFQQPGRYLGTLALALRHRVPGARALLWALLHFAESIVVALELRRRRIDHLHNHFANSAATVGLLATNFLRLPWSLTLHGISETDYPAGVLLGRKIAAARFVACASWFGRAQAMRVTDPMHWHKFEVVRCGVDLAHLPFVRQPSDDGEIICVGRLSAEKGQLGLLHAYAALRERGVSVGLVLVGDGPDRHALEDRCRTLAIESHVRFAGRVDEDSALSAIAAGHLLVLPSFMEGLPVVLMEAMAVGVPVISSRVAGVPELVEDGEEGLLFTPGNWAELGEKMHRLLSDHTLRDAVRNAARLKVQDEFEIGVAVQPLVARFGGVT